MNKLTTINTIKKAAPLALLAVVLSGSAFAGPGKKDRPKGPKLSLDVYTLCKLNADDYQDPFIEVTTTISDTSGDNGNDGMVILSQKAYAATKARGPFKTMSDEGVDLVEDSDPYTVDTYVAELHLCDMGLEPGDRAATAVSIVTVSDGTQFSSKCENPYTDEDGDEMDDADESNIDLDAYAIHCPTW
jgi:hypothetical protein